MWNVAQELFPFSFTVGLFLETVREWEFFLKGDVVICTVMSSFLKLHCYFPSVSLGARIWRALFSWRVRTADRLLLLYLVLFSDRLRKQLMFLAYHIVLILLYLTLVVVVVLFVYARSHGPFFITAILAFLSGLHSTTNANVCKWVTNTDYPVTPETTLPITGGNRKYVMRVVQRAYCSLFGSDHCILYMIWKQTRITFRKHAKCSHSFKEIEKITAEGT